MVKNITPKMRACRPHESKTASKLADVGINFIVKEVRKTLFNSPQYLMKKFEIGQRLGHQKRNPLK